MPMKKTFCFLFLTSFLLAACAGRENHTAAAPEAAQISCPAIEDFPRADELAKLDPGESIRLRLCAEELPLESCEKYFTDELNVFLSQYENIRTNSVVIHEDNLSLVPGENKKSLRSWAMEIHILIDTPFDTGNFDLAEEIAGQISDFLYQYSLFSFKTAKWDTFIIDRNDNVLYNEESSIVHGDETIFALQPGDEYAVQTAAFLYFASNSPYSLQKFGIIPETNELYVEYRIRDDAFDYRNMEKSMAELEALSHDLEEYLLSYHVTNDYISAHEISQLTIAFDIGILGEISEYPYDV